MTFDESEAISRSDARISPVATNPRHNSITVLSPRRIRSVKRVAIYPGSHYVTEQQQLRKSIGTIRDELRERLAYYDNAGRFLEKQRLEQRTMYDLEMLEQMGFCNGIENYSRHLSGRDPGDPPPTLIDYFPDDFLLIIDESHQTIPQVGAMYRGDRSRKETLVEHGFRMPSALDNRPLKFEEFEGYCKKVLFVSATPSEYELEKSQGVVVEQIIRPTGLIDPEIEIRPVGGQVDDLLERIRERVAAGERVLVTTLTKRMAEDLTEYYTELGVRVRYLHSDIDTLERIEILRDLRRGEFDVLVGINLLREGLDLPEVSLVAILDADKEGFLRSHRSLIQTTGRAARNLHGKVIMYADRMTAAMKIAIGETDRRRAIQHAYNIEHDITPQTVTKAILDMSPTSGSRDYFAVPKQKLGSFDDLLKPTNEVDLVETIEAIRQEMFVAAEALDFEKAAKLRDQLKRLRGEAGVAGGTEGPTRKASGRAKPGRSESGGKPGTVNKSSSGKRSRSR